MLDISKLPAHSLCDECWRKGVPDPNVNPSREIDPQEDKCCVCGKQHRSGIILRGPTEGLPQLTCGGKHGKGKSN